MTDEFESYLQKIAQAARGGKSGTMLDILCAQITDENRHPEFDWGQVASGGAVLSWWEDGELRSRIVPPEELYEP